MCNKKRGVDEDDNNIDTDILILILVVHDITYQDKWDMEIWLTIYNF